MNYFSKCSEVQVKNNFVISEMKVYLVKFFLLDIHEALQAYLIWTSLNVTNLYAYLIFFYENYWPRLASISKYRKASRETWRHKILVF